MPKSSESSILARALDELASNLERQAPFLAQALYSWACRISPDGEPSGHFQHPRMFPLLQLPDWVAETLPVSRDPEFHQAVTYSSLCGYYYTRLVDNFIDDDIGTNDEHRSLLPIAGFLAGEFQFAYYRYFPRQHGFWNLYRKIWAQAAESTAHDAALHSVSEDDFDLISSRKFAAAGIPVAAACYFYESPAAVARWMKLTHALARWSQMFDDLLDWQQDQQQARATWFLSEAERRKRPSESVEQWIVYAGGAWGFGLLDCWMEEMREQSRVLGSPGLQEFLLQREALQRRKEKEWKDGVASLAHLASILCD
jgi:hypothetical protein